MYAKRNWSQSVDRLTLEVSAATVRMAQDLKKQYRNPRNVSVGVLCK